MICCQRSNAAVLRRYRKNIAASLHQRTRRRRRECVAPDGLRDVFEFRACLDVFGAHHNREIARLAAGEIEFVEHAAVFIDDGVGPKARPLDVVFLVVSKFLRLL